MKRFYYLLLLLCPYISSLAQPSADNHPGLSINDILPDIPMTNMHNYPPGKARFSAFQKELTIIDFWATWCGSCIGSIAKLQSLQAKHAGQLQMLMVNASLSDDAQKVSGFFKKRQARTGMGFTLPYLLADTVFAALFPHQTIPHCIWIDKSRRIIAITDGGAVTQENIEAALQHKPLHLPLKNDALLFDPHKDELLPAGPAAGAGLLYGSFFVPGKKELGSGIFYEAAGQGRIRQMRMVNYSLLAFYQKAFREVFRHGINRLQADAGARALFQLEMDTEERAQFSYELRAAAISRNAAGQWLKTDLERCFGFTAMAEKRVLDCYVLAPGMQMASLKTKAGPPGTDIEEESLRKHISNQNMQQLITLLEILLKQPVLDETGFTGNIDLELPADIYAYDPARLQAFLRGHGLLLQQSSRQMWAPVLIPTSNN